jgi:hypothetical protein
MENQIASTSFQQKLGNSDDHEYDSYLARVRARFDTMTKGGTAPLFTTDATGLWEAYLDAFPAEQRQFHNCSACRSFIQHFGGLVVISEGVTGSAIWHEYDAPELYLDSIHAVTRLVSRAKVTGVFLSSLPLWGHDRTGIWRHFSLIPARAQVFTHALKSAEQAVAAKHEDFNTVCRALSEFSPTTVDQGLTLLKSDALYRSEKVLGQAQWLHDLHQARAAAGKHTARRDNVTWERVATAPDGFCHPRSSMIGTLLEDIEAGLAFADVSRKFKAKMDPGHYQRPQAPPSAGNLVEAERIFEKLKLAPALRRRFARLDELQTIWVPEPISAAPSNGVFDHLKRKDTDASAPLNVMAQIITWEKFARTVLQDAKTIELLAPSQGNYCALVTAVDPEAPPLLQWDRPEKRNPVSWYVAQAGSIAERWALRSNDWVAVTAVSALPVHWFGGEFPHFGPGALFVLQGAKDTESGGLALFPECLRSELHAVRSTIEAHSKSRAIEAREEASACGLALQQGGSATAHVRVTLANGTRIAYKIDRWD